MQPSLLPSPHDIAGLFTYVLGNPYLFLSSSTVMTTGLVVGTAVMAVVPRSAPLVRVAAPPLAMLLVYFGIGSMVLATQILLRFHYLIPGPAQIQFVSGLGHLLEAAVGIAILFPYLRRRSARTWITANAVAVGYWTIHVLLLTPPWFAFQGQLEMIRAIALGTLVAGAVASAVLWCVAPRPR